MWIWCGDMWGVCVCWFRSCFFGMIPIVSIQGCRSKLLFLTLKYSSFVDIMILGAWRLDMVKINVGWAVEWITLTLQCTYRTGLEIKTVISFRGGCYMHLHSSISSSVIWPSLTTKLGMWWSKISPFSLLNRMDTNSILSPLSSLAHRGKGSNFKEGAARGSGPKSFFGASGVAVSWSCKLAFSQDARWVLSNGFKRIKMDIWIQILYYILLTLACFFFGGRTWGHNSKIHQTNWWFGHWLLPWSLPPLTSEAFRQAL